MKYLSFSSFLCIEALVFSQTNEHNKMVVSKYDGTYRKANKKVLQIDKTSNQTLLDNSENLKKRCNPC